VSGHLVIGSSCDSSTSDPSWLGTSNRTLTLSQLEGPQVGARAERSNSTQGRLAVWIVVTRCFSQKVNRPICKARCDQWRPPPETARGRNLPHTRGIAVRVFRRRSDLDWNVTPSLQAGCPTFQGQKPCIHTPDHSEPRQRQPCNQRRYTDPAGGSPARRQLLAQGPGCGERAHKSRG
jgi:hypothetical protein